ncbi:LVIVD repeat-containing protein, DUF1566 [Desulfonema limicola]|uniref:LVIVD repeat-containing protein, DUF1566 n=1 Tax=Desulfonema limicola TaxID=45656 RepID=A0A975BCN6_9BACT|nr:DUF1566 domain-containing protein [Desulfonema limicola]QTA82764.1 LVIVD repeat-containing protein, DUF1566 [Desulfonema limicola]
MSPINRKTLLILLALSICLLPLFALGFPIPDTGQTKCYDNEKEIPCPNEGEPFYGQDANYTINPMSYTKLDASGNDLPDDATDWVMVRDNVTGLIWEVKTDDDSIHDKDNQYTWQESNNVFVTKLNTDNFGENSDWRLPSREELRTIIDYNIPSPGPTINKKYFPNTISSSYWSSSINADDEEEAWSIFYRYGDGSSSGKSNTRYARAVRGQFQAVSHFTINGDGTVTDIQTDLKWQQNGSEIEMSWEDALTYCEILTLGGYSDWRLPTIKELSSIAELTKYEPAINTEYFPSITSSSNYWSSTTDSKYNGSARYVVFKNGRGGTSHKTSKSYVLAVRGGTSQANPLEPEPEPSNSKIITIENGASNIHINGDYAYIIGEKTLNIYDLTVPDNPELINSISDDNIGRDISLSNKNAYILDTMLGNLNIFDTSNPRNLTLTNSYSVNLCSWFLESYQKYVYLGCDVGGVFIIDVSDPSNPQDIGNIDIQIVNTYYWTKDFAINNEYFYFIGWTDEWETLEPYTSYPLAIIDITNAKFPRFNSYIYIPGRPSDIAVSQNYAYITITDRFNYESEQNWNTLDSEKASLEIIDISNSENPLLINSIQIPFPQKVFISGAYAFVLSSENNSDSSLYIVNISNPEQPTIEESIEIPGENSDLWIYNSYAYVVGEQGLHVVDLSSFITYSSITPEISQRPLAGSPGTTFTQWGSGFTKNSTATLHIFDETGDEIGTDTVNIKADGSFEIPYTPSEDKALGKYTWYAVDDTTGSKSQQEITYEITATAYPEISNNPQHGNLFTEFEQIGTGFTPGETATLYFFDDSGQSLGTEKVDIQADGTFKIPYNPPEDKPLGRYYWYAIDDKTGNQTLEVEYWIEEGENQSPDIVHYPPIIAEPGKNLTITATITDSTNYIKNVSIFYRNPGVERDSDEPEFITYPPYELSSGDETFELEVIIPKDVITNNGIEYYIEAIDDNDAMSSVGSSEIPIFVPAGFIWQKISIEQEIYTVSVIADEVPENPKEYVYPLFDGSDDAKKYDPKAIYITDSNNEIVTKTDLQRKILALARNAAIYRLWARMDTDPIPILKRESSPINFETVSQTPQFCGKGNTDTSFGADYPGHLVFPEVYNKETLIFDLVDWEKGDFCLWKGDQVFHPSSLTDFNQRKEIYKDVLRHIILQNGAGIEKEDKLELLNKIVEVLKLYGTADALSVATSIQGAIKKITGDIDNPFDMLSLSTIGKEALVSAIQEYISFIDNYEDLAKISSRVIKSIDIFGKILSVAGSIADYKELEGIYIDWQLTNALLYGHGFQVLENTIESLSEINGKDSALNSAVEEIRSEFDEEVIQNFIKEFEKKIKLQKGKITLNAIQFAVAEVGALLIGTPAAPVGLIMVIGDTALGIIRLGYDSIVAKIEKEELHQAILLLSTLESSWYNNPLKKELNELAHNHIASKKAINKLNWNVSTRLYQAIFITDKIYEEQTEFMNTVFAGKDKKKMIEDMKNFKERLITHMKGQIDEGAEYGDMLNRISGKLFLNDNYVFFVPERELKELLNILENPKESHSENGIKYTLNSPGEIGIIDPVGRRCGAFVNYDENGEQKIIEINEIPGATFNRNSHSKEIYAPISATGDNKVKLTGTDNGAYTLSVRETSEDNTIISENQFTGEFEKGKTEDALINISDAGITIESEPTARGMITGTIINNISGNPVENAYISADTKGAISDSDGKFEISDIEPKEYFIKVETEGFQTYISEKINLSPNENKNIEIKLTPVTRYYFDNDGDGLGNPETMIEATSKPDGFVENADDADDTGDSLPEAPATTNLTVNAGSDQTVNERTTVSLSGSAENGTEPITYNWVQTSGTTVQLNNSSNSTPDFTAPNVGDGSITLTFQLTVTDNTGAQATDTCNIVVKNIDSEQDTEGPGPDDSPGCFISTIF